MTITWSPDCSSVAIGADRRHARGEREAGLAALDRGDVGLERRARRVLRARVLVSLVPAELLLHVGRGLEDRRDDGAGGRIGLLAGVDADGGEVFASGELHSGNVIIRPIADMLRSRLPAASRQSRRTPPELPAQRPAAPDLTPSPRDLLFNTWPGRLFIVAAGAEARRRRPAARDGRARRDRAAQQRRDDRADGRRSAISCGGSSC